MEAKYRAASLAASTGDNQEGDDEEEDALPSSAVYSWSPPSYMHRTIIQSCTNDMVLWTGSMNKYPQDPRGIYVVDHTSSNDYDDNIIRDQIKRKKLHDTNVTPVQYTQRKHTTQTPTNGISNECFIYWESTVDCYIQWQLSTIYHWQHDLICEGCRGKSVNLIKNIITNKLGLKF